MDYIALNMIIYIEGLFWGCYLNKQYTSEIEPYICQIFVGIS